MGGPGSVPSPVDRCSWEAGATSECEGSGRLRCGGHGGGGRFLPGKNAETADAAELKATKAEGEPPLPTEWDRGVK